MKRLRYKKHFVRKARRACTDGAESEIGVAYEVGFSNLSYFSKVFKEEFGLPAAGRGVAQ